MLLGKRTNYNFPMKRESSGTLFVSEFRLQHICRVAYNFLRSREFKLGDRYAGAKMMSYKKKRVACEDNPFP